MMPFEALSMGGSSGRRRWGRCHHPAVRCVHGDEINWASGRRCACLVCGAYLSDPLPEVCTVTGERHLAISDPPP